MKSRTKVITLGLVLFIAFFAVNMLNSKQDSVSAKEGTSVGNNAPNFTLTDLSGKKVNLQDVIRSNRVTILNFWATWCPPCRSEIPEFIRFSQKYSRQQVTIIAVNLQEKTDEVRTFAQKNGMNFPILLDQSGNVGGQYQIYAIPTTLFINNSGIIQYKIEGATTMSTLENNVNAMLKGN